MSGIKNLLARLNDLETETANLSRDYNRAAGLVHDYANLIQRLYVLSMDDENGKTVILNEINEFLLKNTKKESNHVGS